MEIILVYHLDPFFDGKGGAVRYVNDLTRNLLKEGISVKLLGAKLTNRTSKYKHFCFIPVIDNSNSWWKYLLALTFKLPSLKLSHDAIIHVHRIEYIVPFMIFYKNNPLVYTIHGDRLGTAKSQYSASKYKLVEKLYFKYEKIAFNRVQKIIAVSERSKSSFTMLHSSIESKITTIPVSIDVERFNKKIDKKYSRNKFSINSDDILILFVGVLGKVKNLNFLIDSFNILSSKKEDVKLIIVGDGDEKNNLIKKVEHLDLAQKVKFTGEINNASIYEVYAISDLFALTSRSEGSPNVVREALASGIPVVSTNVGDVKEIINDRYLGIVVDNYSEEDFADALLKTISLIYLEKQIVHLKCKNAAKKYGAERVTKEIITIYESLNKR